MTTYVLHGGFTSTRNELNNSFYKELCNRVPKGGVILLVYFSREDKEIRKLFEGDIERIKEHLQGKDIHYLCANEKEFIAQIKKADVIYMRGGDTIKLQNALVKFQEFKEAIKNKTVAGSSAGAYVLSTYYYSNSRRNIYKGLGIIPARIICHYNSDAEEFNTSFDPVLLMERYDANLELIVLRDSEWKIIEV